MFRHRPSCWARYPACPGVCLGILCLLTLIFLHLSYNCYLWSYSSVRGNWKLPTAYFQSRQNLLTVAYFWNLGRKTFVISSFFPPHLKNNSLSNSLNRSCSENPNASRDGAVKRRNISASPQTGRQGTAGNPGCPQHIPLLSWSADKGFYCIYNTKFFYCRFSFQSISVWGLIVLVYYFYWVSPRSAWFEAKTKKLSWICWLCDFGNWRNLSEPYFLLHKILLLNQASGLLLWGSDGLSRGHEGGAFVSFTCWICLFFTE